MKSNKKSPSVNKTDKKEIFPKSVKKVRRDWAPKNDDIVHTCVCAKCQTPVNKSLRNDNHDFTHKCEKCGHNHYMILTMRYEDCLMREHIENQKIEEELRRKKSADFLYCMSCKEKMSVIPGTGNFIIFNCHNCYLELELPDTI